MCAVLTMGHTLQHEKRARVERAQALIAHPEDVAKFSSGIGGMVKVWVREGEIAVPAARVVRAVEGLQPGGAHRDGLVALMMME